MAKLKHAEDFEPETKREELFWDVFVTFCEDPHNVFQCIEYYPYGTKCGKKPFAIVEDTEDYNEETKKCKQYRIDFETVEQAFKVNEKLYKALDQSQCHISYLRKFNNCYKESSMGAEDLDAYDVLTLMQLGIFGKVVYG